jgi:gluconate 5-dehydrogenase
MNVLSSFSLAGRRALITGSTQGIGFALARGLAEAGAQVILNGRDPAKLEKAVDELTMAELKVEGAAFDVTNAEQVSAAIGLLLSGGKPIDILVNNAGINRRMPLLEIPLEEWHRVLDTDLTSAFLVSRVVAPGMIARKAGKIVNICSLMSDLARPTTGAYAAAKGGLRMLTKTMCVEWAKENIQINGISPGYFETPLTQVLVNDPQFDGWIKARTPANRWGQVEELAGACVFLCSPAASFVNGHLLTVDGGLSAVI